MDQQSPNLTDRQIFAKTLWDAISNTLWFSAAAFVIVLITALWMPLAVVLAALFLIVIAIDVVWVLGSMIIPAFIIMPLAIRSGHFGKEAWAFAASITRLLDVGAGIILAYYIYWRIF